MSNNNFDLIPWRKRHNLYDLFLDDIFDNFSNIILEPTTDIYEEDNNIVIENQMPGLDKKDIEISYDKDTIKISGKKSEEKETKKKNFYQKETRSGFYERVIRLPENVDYSKAKAEYKNGVLKIVLPKASEKETEKVNTISVE